MRALPFLVLLLPACIDRQLGTFNSPPSVSIISPVDGSAVDPGGTVEFIGQVGDGQTASEDLKILWQSSVDGDLDETPADTSGAVYYATSALSGGDHTITLTAADEGGKSASASVTIHVAPGGSGPGSPQIDLLAPLEGDEWLSTEAHNVIATVTDDKDQPQALNAEIVDVPDGSIWAGNPSIAGNITAPWNFSIGSHSLTLTAVDSDANRSSKTVNFDVVDGGAPTISIVSPVSGSAYDGGQPITFEATVGDDLTPVENLTVEWSSDLQGVLSTAPADSSGNVAFTTSGLSGGTHTITLAVTDSDGKQSRKHIQVTINDPRDRDDDGDGYTENQGDCDDTNPLLNPGMVDVCDAYDNNCDGETNGDDWDHYEPNDTLATGYNFGSVGDSIWSSQTVSLSGLTIHAKSDEDYFLWTTGDIIIIDNVDISITVSGLPTGGSYVAELYDISNGSVRDSDSGSGTLRIHYVGDWLSGDETDWALHIYATTWPANSCSSTYKLTISS